MNHSLDIRVYYEDTDSGGVVYYANYLKFAERARTELLRFEGFENKSLQDREGILFVVRHIEANYFKPAFLDDLLNLETEVTEIKNTSTIMKQSVFRQNDLIFSAKVTLVCVGLKTLKPARLPDSLKAGFQKYYSKD